MTPLELDAILSVAAKHKIRRFKLESLEVEFLVDSVVQGIVPATEQMPTDDQLLYYSTPFGPALAQEKK